MGTVKRYLNLRDLDPGLFRRVWLGLLHARPAVSIEAPDIHPITSAKSRRKPRPYRPDPKEAS